MSDIEKLIFGKDDTENIVSIEVEDDTITVFMEKDGKVTSKTQPNKFWLLSKAKRKDAKRLDGSLFYKWITTFDDREEFLEARKNGFKHRDFSVYDSKESAMIYNGMTYFKGMKVQDVSVLSFDIETTGIAHNEDSKVLLISNTYRSKTRTIRKLFCYDKYDNDKEFFDDWCAWVRKINPSIMIGHNIFGYDLPYMMYCAERAGTTLNLGRNNSEIVKDSRVSKFRKDGSQQYDYNNIYIYGREIIDTFFLAIKYDFARNYVSYGLKQIIAQEGLEVDDRQHYDAGTIKDNYKNPEEWEKIKLYAKHDADDSLSLYDLMINSYFY